VVPTNSSSTRSSTFIIAYPIDEGFRRNPLVQLAQRNAKFRQLHDVLAAVFDDPQIQLAMRHDLLKADSQATWNGRPALPLVVTGCLAVVRRLMGWSYRVLAEQVNVSAGWRWVCQLYDQAMPNFRTIRDREALLRPKTLALIQATVVYVGQAVGVTRGARLRVDSSVTESDIHYPTDSSLLNDAARVLSRLVRQARAVLDPQTAADKVWFRDRHRQARRLARQIGQLARKGRKNAEKSSLKWYRQLLQVVTALVAQVAYIQPRLAHLTSLAALGVHQLFTTYLPLVQRVIDQTKQRVLHGQSVAATDKVVSLFEPHTAIICRGKAKPKDTEFGHKIWYAEVEGGLISEYRILPGNPPDAQQLLPSLKTHRRLFGKAPREVSGDRGIYSPQNERAARAVGVRRVSLPKPGHKSKRRQRRERQAWFRAAQRFRNGIEGRISHLRRARGLTRCLNHGLPGLERWIGWAIIANNIAVIVMNLNKRHVALSDVLS
jgi:transposase, IS5 family